jgi:hypothetical protein
MHFALPQHPLSVNLNVCGWRVGRGRARALVFALACDMARSSPCQRVTYTAGRQEGRWMNGKVSGHICSMAWKEVENRDSMKWLEQWQPSARPHRR